MLKIIISVLIFVLSILITGNLSAEDFVNMVAPAESLALGDTYVADNEGPNSSWLNPAGFAKNFVNQYSIGGGRWVGEVNLFLGSVVIPTPYGNFGGGLSWLGMKPEEYEDVNGLYTGEMLDFQSYLFNVGYGLELLHIPLGVNFKFVQSSFAMDNKLLVLADIGMMYNMGNLSLGGMLKNFAISGYDTGDWGEIRVGAAWQVFSFNFVGLKVLGDLISAYEEPFNFNTGIDIEIFKIANLRIGFAPMGYNQFQFGAGTKFIIGNWRLKLDYGMNPALEGLNMSHFVQITLNSRKRELFLKTESHLNKANDFIASGNFDQAEWEIKKALEISPEDKTLQQKIKRILAKKRQKQAETYMNAAEKYIKLKDYTRAKKELLKVIEFAPEKKEGHFELGKIYYEQGDYRNALKSFRKALEIDRNYSEADEYVKLLDKKVAEQKPIWLKEDKFYSTKTLVFEDFEKELIMAKLIADEGDFENVTVGKEKYGKWTFKKSDKDKVLETAIRLPNLSKFKGIMISLKSTDVKKIKVVLVEQLDNAANQWQVPLANIGAKWKKIQIPFHYLQLPGKPTANIDLGKITQIKFIISKDKSGSLDFDNFELFQ